MLEWPRGWNGRRHHGLHGRGERSGARVVCLGECDELTSQQESLLDWLGYLKNSCVWKQENKIGFAALLVSTVRSHFARGDLPPHAVWNWNDLDSSQHSAVIFQSTINQSITKFKMKFWYKPFKFFFIISLFELILVILLKKKTFVSCFFLNNSCRLI